MTEITQRIVMILETLPKTAPAEMIFPVKDDNSLAETKKSCLTKSVYVGVNIGLLLYLLSVIRMTPERELQITPSHSMD